jgi:hypothetical protein
MQESDSQRRQQARICRHPSQILIFSLADDYNSPPSAWFHALVVEFHHGNII